MSIPLGFSALSAIALAITLMSQDYSDYQIFAASCLAASLFLLFQNLWQRRKPARARSDVIIDGSNVMHWLDDKPQLQPLLDVIACLHARDLSVGVVFDANAGWKLWDRYRDDYFFSRKLGLSEQQVLVVAKGQPADPVILAAARENNAVVITNDRYRDWAEQYPEVTQPGYLIRGGYRQGQLWLDERALTPGAIAAS